MAGLAGFGLGASTTAALLTLMFRNEVRAIEGRMVEIVSGIVRDIDHTRTAPETSAHPQVDSNLARAWLRDMDQQREKLDELTARAQHVIDGGHFDDSPTKWKKAAK